MRKGRASVAAFVGSTTSLTQKTKVRSLIRNQLYGFKKKAVEEYANSQQSAAITAKLLSRVSTFNEEIERQEKTTDDFYCIKFSL